MLLKKKPFYNLCDIITLDRIAKEDYIVYLQKASLAKWHKSLSALTLDKILTCSERHSYYLNKLCSILWLGKQPTSKMVTDVWENFVAENKSAIERELALLTLNQRKILTMVAQADKVREPFGKAFLTQLDTSSSSAARAFKLLIDKDYILLDPNTAEYKLLDPLIKGVLVDF